MMNRKVLGVFGKTLVGGYGVEIKIEADITVLVTYRRSQEKENKGLTPVKGCQPFVCMLVCRALHVLVGVEVGDVGDEVLVDAMLAVGTADA